MLTVRSEIGPYRRSIAQQRVFNPLFLIQGALQGIQLGLEFALTLLDDFKFKLITMKLNRRVVDVSPHLGVLGLVFTQGPLQFAFHSLEFVQRAPFKEKLFWRG